MSTTDNATAGTGRLNGFARKAVLTGVLVGSLGGIGSGVATAATTDPSLHASDSSDYKASCSYAVNVDWNRQANRLTGLASADNHETFVGCRKAAVVTFTDDDGAEIVRRYDLPTLGGTWDPTAPHRLDTPLDVSNIVGKRDVPFIDHLEVKIVDRTK